MGRAGNPTSSALGVTTILMMKILGVAINVVYLYVIMKAVKILSNISQSVISYAQFYPMERAEKSRWIY